MNSFDYLQYTVSAGVFPDNQPSAFPDFNPIPFLQNHMFNESLHAKSNRFVPLGMKILRNGGFPYWISLQYLPISRTTKKLEAIGSG